MAIIKGIDLSEWQENVDFHAIKKSGIDFVILRASYGTSRHDYEFENHYKKAKEAGLKVGAYHYSYAESIEDAKLEAENFLSALKNKQFEYPVYFDIEESFQFEYGSKFCQDITNTFCEIVEDNGYFVGVYSNGNGFMNYLGSTIWNKYTVWLAEWTYADKPSYYTGPFSVWQFTENGRVTGYDGDVDLNYSYIEFDKIIKENGLNGFKKQEVKKEKSIFQKIGDYNYYIVNGQKKYGFQKVGNYTYYFREKTGTQAFGFQFISGYWYYFRENTGTMATGWQYINKNWYYFRESGTMVTGYQFIDGIERYFDSKGRFVKDGKLQEKNRPTGV